MCDRSAEVVRLILSPPSPGWQVTALLLVFPQSYIRLTGLITGSFCVVCFTDDRTPPSSCLQHISRSAHVSCIDVRDRWRWRQQTTSLHAWFCLALYDRYAVHPTLSLFHSFWCSFNGRHFVSMTPLSCVTCYQGLMMNFVTWRDIPSYVVSLWGI